MLYMVLFQTVANGANYQCMGAWAKAIPDGQRILGFHVRSDNKTHIPCILGSVHLALQSMQTNSGLRRISLADSLHPFFVFG
jgi:hypothetical protein